MVHPDGNKLEKKDPKEGLKTLLMAGGSFAIPAALTYLLSRRVNTAGMTRGEAQVAQKIRERGLALIPLRRGDIPKGDFLRWLQYGGQKTYIEPKTTELGNVLAPSLVERLKKDRPGALFLPTQAVPNKLRGIPVLGSRSGLPPFAEDKLLEYKQFLKKYGIPTTRAAKYTKGTTSPSLKDVAQFTGNLNKKLPKGWIIKPSGEAQTAGTLPTSKDDLKSIFKQFIKIKRTQKVPGTGFTPEQIMKLKREHFDNYAERISANPEYQTFGHLMGALKTPEEYSVQPLIKMKKLSPLERGYHSVFGEGAEPTRELRIHTVGGRVMPGSMPRFSSLRDIPSILGIRSPEVAGAEKHIQKFLRQAPKKYQKGIYGFDIAVTPGGGYKIIESNPGYSGILWGAHKGKFDPSSALVMNRLISKLQGQSTVPLALLHSTAAGTAGLGAYGAYRGGKELLEPES